MTKFSKTVRSPSKDGKRSCQSTESLAGPKDVA